MNNDPLKRRMFAQQMMNQHNRANEPMGILASSPQLMNAAQGLANGGMVKGYKLGGSSYGPFPEPESLETYFDPGQSIVGSDGRVVRDGGGGSLLYNLAGKNKREEMDKQGIKEAREYYTKKRYDDAQNLKNQIEPGDRVKSTSEADEYDMTTNKDHFPRTPLATPLEPVMVLIISIDQDCPIKKFLTMGLLERSLIMKMKKVIIKTIIKKTIKNLEN